MSKVPEGFRDTPLGPLPETWDVVSLGEVITQRRETVDPRDVPGLVYVGLEHLDTGDPKLKRWGDALQVRSAKSRFYPGDTLYGKLRPYLDKAVLAEARGICSTDILVLTAREVLDSAFLPYLMHMRAVLNHAIATTSGVNHPRTSWRALSRLGLGLPSLPEQRAISHVLRTVHRAREATDGVIAAVRELKRSLMRHLFTYGPVPVDEAEQVELQETEIGPIPAHWEMVRLGDVIEEGPQNGMYKPQSLYGRGTPIVRIDDCENEGSVVTRARNRVQLSEAEVSKYGLQLNDILVNRVNSLSHLGKTAFIGPLVEPMVFESNMMRFRVNQRLADPECVFRFLCAPVCRDQMRGMAKRAVAQSSINQGDVKSIALPRPPLAEQRQVTHILSMVDAKIVAEEARREALDALFHSLLHHLMTGRIRTQEFQRQDARTPSREEENLGDFAP